MTTREEAEAIIAELKRLRTRIMALKTGRNDGSTLAPMHKRDATHDIEECLASLQGFLGDLTEQGR